MCIAPQAQPPASLLPGSSGHAGWVFALGLSRLRSIHTIKAPVSLVGRLLGAALATWLRFRIELGEVARGDCRAVSEAHWPSCVVCKARTTGEPLRTERHWQSVGGRVRRGEGDTSGMARGEHAPGVHTFSSQTRCVD